MNDNRKQGNILQELILGMVSLAMIEQVVLLILGNDLLYRSAGIWIGTLIAAVMTIHMKRSIEDALELDGATAEKLMKRRSLLRMGLVAVILGVLFAYGIANIYTTFIGMLGLKISAYLQPYLYKLLKNLRKGGS